MQFCSLDATFGKLEHRSLTFTPGLNIVEAPNESGKSTLAAFLRTMLYGLKTSERGALAEKNRYAPWSGSSMRGVLSLACEQGDITIQRDTARANAPMGRFSAVYTGTGESVADLTSAGCGEALLGIPREVYERSAFIRQSGLAIDADTELERRIVALITTGEEGTSYSEAAAALKKQLNSRRHNKTGQIPALEQSIAADESNLSELRALSLQCKGAEAELAALQSEQKQLQSELSLHELADRQEQFEALREAKHAAEEADAKAETVYRMMDAVKTPARAILEQGKAKLQTLDELNTQRRQADTKLRSAQEELSAFETLPRKAVKRSHLIIISVIGFILLALFLAGYFLRSASLIRWSGAFLVFACALCVFFRLKMSRQRKAYEAELDRHSDAVREAEAACAALGAAYETQCTSVLADIPAEDITHAPAYISEAIARYELLAQLEREAQLSQMHFEVLQKQMPAEETLQHVERPSVSREALEDSLTRNLARCSELQRTIDYNAGRIRAIGDAQELENALAEKRERLTVLQEQYDAIALAMDSLERANTALQNRFSPALGARAAELFSQLTDGKYNKVLLDRTFNALIEERDDAITHDAALLSQGAADQLYLAVRLAICDLVLPAEKNIPLVLDDALINFDDARCTAALELLLQESETRQILLLTCQHREAAYLSGRDNVTVLTL